MKLNHLYIIVSLAVISILYTLSPFTLRAAPVLTIEDGAQAMPDLVITAIDLDPLNPTLGSGTSTLIDIQPTVQNQGDAAATIIRFNLYLEPPYTPTITTTVTTEFTYGLGLVPGQIYDGWTATGKKITRVPPYICIWVDPENQVEESDETNNIFCINPPLPDPPIPESPTPEPSATPDIEETPLPPPPEDSFEDDDICADAKPIVLDAAPQARNLTRDGDDGTDRDFDWVKFSAQSGVTYVARADAVGEDAALNLGLYSQCEGPPSFGSGTSATFTAPQDGEYYLVITHSDDDYGTQTAYTLKVSAVPACARYREPNNTCNMPVDYPMNDEDGQVHTFCEEGDVDWIRFQVQAGGKYRVTATDEGPDSDLKMGLFQECDETGLSDMEAEFEAIKNGKIYIKLENKDPNLHGANAKYSVLVEELARGCEQDFYEDDNNLAEAQELFIDSSKQTHNVCPRRDKDWVKLEATVGVTYTVETYNLEENADTELCMHDSNGAELRCDKDSGAGLGSRLTIINSQDEIYYFSVKDEDPEVAGKSTEYELRAFTGLCKFDSYEPDNDQDRATLLATDGTKQQHNACPADDVDWIRFEAEANTYYTISTDEVGPEGDTEITLYDGETLLARNDDHTPGITSQLVYLVANAGTYYVKIQLYNPTYSGSGTEYSINIIAGEPATPEPTTTPTAAPTLEPDATPPATDVRTLILVNPARLNQLHSGDAAGVQNLLDKLQSLAHHEKVMGEVIHLNKNEAVTDAYAAWTGNAESLKDVEKANQVADAIRRLIMTYLSQREGVQYVVLVGDDQALPFRRVYDNTPQQSENTYLDVNDNHPSGAAILANYFMTDDFYADREPTPHKGRELYIPDLAVSRLIEIPADMIYTIDRFLASPVTEFEDVLVTGYDFVQDSAAKDCVSWRKFLGDDERVECLIGENWSERDLEDLQLSDDPPYKIQSINGHADHYREGIPRSGGGGEFSATEIEKGIMDLSGGLLYTLACHAGLNVPEANSTNTTDLPEVFIRYGANYVGNTGFGWGYLSGIGLSELVIQLFTKELIRGGAMGNALMNAKQQYYQRTGAPTPYDEKVMQQLVFYGLPMFELKTPSALSPIDDPFPGVTEQFDNSASLSPDDDLLVREATFDFSTAIQPDVGILSTEETDDGVYQAFGGFSYAPLNQPVQPLYFRDVTVPNQPVRSVVILEADVADVQENFNPVIASPDNEFVDNPEASLSPRANVEDIWYPPINAQIQTLNGDSNLVAQLGQYNPKTGEQRTYGNLKVDIYYSTSTDVEGPEFTIIGGLYEGDETGLVRVKAGLIDDSGIEKATLSYIVDGNQSQSSIRSGPMNFNASSQKWEGEFVGSLNSIFYVSAVDRAGNRTTSDNKGAKYRPAPARLGISTPTPHSKDVYLPIIQNIE